MKPETIKDLRELEKRNRGFYPTHETLEKAWAALPELLDAADKKQIYDGSFKRAVQNWRRTDADLAASQKMLQVLADENAELRDELHRLKYPGEGHDVAEFYQEAKTDDTTGN